MSVSGVFGIFDKTPGAREAILPELFYILKSKKKRTWKRRDQPGIKVTGTVFCRRKPPLFFIYQIYQQKQSGKPNGSPLCFLCTATSLKSYCG